MATPEPRPGLDASTRSRSLVAFVIDRVGPAGILGILLALAWPVYTVYPEPRLGGLAMPNALLYAAVFWTSSKILIRNDAIRIAGLALLALLVTYAWPVFRADQLDAFTAQKKAIDILITHSVFLVAGISAAFDFRRVAVFFFATLSLIVTANLLISFHPAFTVQDRTTIGFLGGQGFARIVSLTAIGLIVVAKPDSKPAARIGFILIVSIAVWACLYTGARSSLLGIAIALVVYLSLVRVQLSRILLILIVAGGLCAWIVMNYYVDFIRPLLLQGDPNSGYRRTLLSLDLFFIGQVETKQTLASILERAVLWQDGLRIAFEFPAGTGFGGYEIHTRLGREVAPHNVPIEALLEMGFVIGSLFLIVLAVATCLACRMVMPCMLYLIVFFQFSGDLVDLRQLIFFVGVTLYQLVTRARFRQAPRIATHDES